MKNIFQQLKDFYIKSKKLSVVVFAIALLLWYITIPAVILIYIWRNQKMENKYKLLSTCIVFILTIIFVASMFPTLKTPEITITSPQDKYTIQAKEIEIKGTIKPKNSQMTLNGFLPVSIDSEGNFTAKLVLKSETNTARLEATNVSKTASKEITVNRIFTDQEKADIKLATEKAQKEAEIQTAKAKAEQEAYDRSPAGRICKKNPTWDKDDCELISKHRYWIGMTYDMLVASLGRPDDINTSNYGRGNRYQYCYSRNYRLTCLYDTDGDDIIDSYN